MFGAKKQVLIVGNDSVQLYVVKGKKVSLYRDYAEAGGSLSTELAKAFRANKAPLIILYDVVEQQYRKETIPKVGFLDKNKVIKRKLQMAFPQQQMVAYLPLKQKPRENEGLIALFAGLATNLTITQVMDAVISSEVALQGAGLLPLESAALVLKMTEEVHKRAKTPNNSRWSVLMTHHKTGGLRQIIVKDGELALTRLTPLALDTLQSGGLAEEMVREFNATLTYLSRFGYIPNDGLDLIVVAAPDIIQKFRGYNLPVSGLYALSVVEAAKLIGIEAKLSNMPDDFAEVIHAGWNGMQRKLAVPLTAPTMDKVKNTRQFAQMAIFALVLGIGYMGWKNATLYMDMESIKNSITEENSRIAALQHQHDVLAKKLLRFTHDPEIVRTSLDTYDQYAKEHIDLEPTFNAIIALVKRDKMHIREISVVQQIEEASIFDEFAVPEVPPEGAHPEKPKIVVNITLGFPSQANVEDSARLTNEFADALRNRFTGREVTVSEMIGNLSIDKTVQGVSEQIAPDMITGHETKEDTSIIVLKGAIE